MSKRVYFDQHTVQKDFASFTTDELFGAKSLLGSLLSLLSKDEENWNSAFRVAGNENGDLAAIVVGSHLYLVSLESNRIIKYRNVACGLDCHVTFPRGDVGPAVLAKNKVIFFSKDLEVVREAQLKWGCDALFTIRGRVLALRKTSIIDVEDENEIFKELPQWQRAFGVGESIVLVKGSSVSAVNINGKSEFATIVIENSNVVLDCAFSSNRENFYVLDSEHEVSVFSVKNGFEKIDKFEAGGACFLCPWGANHVVASDEFGSMFFIAVGTHQTQQQAIKPQSVVRGVADGFLLFEPQDEAGDSYHFDLAHFSAVTPFELYQRNCAEGFFGDALVLMRTFNFDKDIYFKAYIKQNDLTISLLNENIPKISDKNWVYDFCVETLGDSVELNAKLIQLGLEIKPNDSVLMSYRERLQIFNKLYRDGFISSEWKKFRSCNMEAEMTAWAQKSLFSKMAIVFKQTTELDEKAKERVLWKVSPFAKPGTYSEIMPSDLGWFRDRAVFIDDVTGQTSILVELMKVGARMMPTLNEEMQLANEFDAYITKVADNDSYVSMSYSEYVKMSDQERLFLFAKRKTASELASLLSGDANSILERDIDALAFILADPLVSVRPTVLAESSFAERMTGVSLILKQQQKGFSSKFVNDVIWKIPVNISYDTSKLLKNEFGAYMNSENALFVQYLGYLAKYSKPCTFGEVKQKLDQDTVMAVTNKILERPQGEWKDYYMTMRKLNTKNDKLAVFLKESNLRAMIKLADIDNIDIQTDSERDIAVEMVAQLCTEARSCSLEDDHLKAALTCLGKIPGDKMNQETNRLFEKFRVYQTISEVDPSSTPKDIDSCQDINVLISAIIDKKKYPYNIEQFHNAITEMAKQMGGADMRRIESKFAEICLRNGRALFGVKFLADSDDSIRLEYLETVDFDQADEICNESILRCDQELLPRFIAWKEKHSTTHNDDLAVLNGIAMSTNEKLFRFGFQFINPESRREVMKQYCQSMASVSPDDFLALIDRMRDFGLIDQNEYSDYQSFASEQMTSSGNIGDKYKAILEAEKKGFKVNSKTKSHVFTLQFLEKAGLNLGTDFTIEQVLKLLEEKSGSLSDSDLASLVKCWHEAGLLTPEATLRSALLSSPSGLIQNREMWASVSTEPIEQDILRKTANIAFGMSSQWASVTEEAKALAKKESHLPDAVIDQIIERRETHLFVDTVHFDTIIRRAKSVPQLQQIFDSLQSNGQQDALVQFLVVFFEIPRQFRNPIDAPAIINRAKAILNRM